MIVLFLIVSFIIWYVWFKPRTVFPVYISAVRKVLNTETEETLWLFKDGTLQLPFADNYSTIYFLHYQDEVIECVKPANSNYIQLPKEITKYRGKVILSGKDVYEFYI